MVAESRSMVGISEARKQDALFPLEPLSKRALLDSLPSNGKLDYKRYLGSPLRYAGGKSLAVGYVVELLPENLDRLVSPFMGGGSVEIACARELGMDVIAYDIFDILCAYWQIQISRPEELYRRLQRFDPNRDTFRQVKERLSAHWREGETLDQLDLAAHYYFNSNTSYGPALPSAGPRTYISTSPATTRRSRKSATSERRLSA